MHSSTPLSYRWTIHLKYVMVTLNNINDKTKIPGGWETKTS
jgi:hypothetical protein